MVNKIKPAGYWLNWDNVQREVITVVGKIGHFPTSTELSSRGYGGLLAAVPHYGGLPAIRTKMGYTEGSTPKGYWKKWENVEAALKEIIEEIGHFPNRAEVTRSGRSYLVKAAGRFGGLDAARGRIEPGYKNRENVDYSKWGNVRRELTRVARIVGRFPSRSDIKKYSSRNLVSAISDHHGSLSKARDKMGYGLTPRPPGYWQNWSNTKRGLREYIKRTGSFPNVRDLTGTSDSPLRGAIEIHGGVAKVRKRLGLKADRKSPGHWKKWENVEAEIKKFIKKRRRFPRQLDFERLGLTSLNAAIYEYHDGLTGVRKRMGYSLEANPAGYWKDEGNIIAEAIKATTEIGAEELPNARVLREKGYQSLSCAICSFPGGFPALREKINESRGNSKSSKLERFMDEYLEEDMDAA